MLKVILLALVGASFQFKSADSRDDTPPEVTITTQIGNWDTNASWLTVNSGDTVELVCWVSGGNSVLLSRYISWSRISARTNRPESFARLTKDEDLDRDLPADKYQHTFELTEDGDWLSTLKIVSANETDGGIYSCSAEPRPRLSSAGGFSAVSSVVQINVIGTVTTTTPTATPTTTPTPTTTQTTTTSPEFNDTVTTKTRTTTTLNWKLEPYTPNVFTNGGNCTWRTYDGYVDVNRASYFPIRNSGTVKFSYECMAECEENKNCVAIIMDWDYKECSWTDLQIPVSQLLNDGMTYKQYTYGYKDCNDASAAPSQRPWTLLVTTLLLAIFL